MGGRWLREEQKLEYGGIEYVERCLWFLETLMH